MVTKTLALAFRLTPTDNLTVDLRVNDRDYNESWRPHKARVQFVVSEAGGMLTKLLAESATPVPWCSVGVQWTLPSLVRLLADRTNPLVRFPANRFSLWAVEPHNV